MATVWERVGQLEGQTLRTKTGKAFTVVSVDRQYVTVNLGRTGTVRSIRRVEVEAAHDLCLSLDELTATRFVKGLMTVVNLVYIVSILKAIAGDISDLPRPEIKTMIHPEQSSTEDFTSQLGRMEEFTSQWERIVKLYRQGILSDQDFAQAKLKLLKITE